MISFFIGVIVGANLMFLFVLYIGYRRKIIDVECEKIDLETKSKLDLHERKYMLEKELREKLRREHAITK